MSVENLKGGQTTTYSVQVCQTHSTGICANPVAGGPAQNSSLVRLSSPFELLSVYYHCVSEGKPPLVPSHRIYSKNPNRTFLGGERVGVMTPALVGHLFMMAGRLDFAVLAPEGISSDFCLAKMPWEQSAVTDFVIVAAQFLDSGIINDTWNQPAGVVIDPDVPLLNAVIP